MVATDTLDEPGGIKVLSGTFTRHNLTGEAYIEAPDGSISHVEWGSPGDLRFEEVPIADSSQGHGELEDADGEELQRLLPDLWKSAEEIQEANRRDLPERMIPGLRAQWESWRTPPND